MKSETVATAPKSLWSLSVDLIVGDDFSLSGFTEQADAVERVAQFMSLGYVTRNSTDDKVIFYPITNVKKFEIYRQAPVHQQEQSRVRK